MEIIGVDEARKIFPLMDKQYFCRALYDPVARPRRSAGVTNAYAKAARKLGAEIYRHTRVTDLVARSDGSWDVITDKGNVRAEHVVNAGGLWAREGRPHGGDRTCRARDGAPVPHHQRDSRSRGVRRRRCCTCIDFEGEIYMRQEGKGMLIGTYETRGVPWAERETPWNFTHELLAERPRSHRRKPRGRLPAISPHSSARASSASSTAVYIRADGNPLIGPFAVCATTGSRWRAWRIQSRRRRRSGLSNWMIDGDPGFDVWAMDVARFGDWARRRIRMRRCARTIRAGFGSVFRMKSCPRRGRADDARVRAVEAKRAGIRRAYGLEHPAVVRAASDDPSEDVTYRRSNAHEPVGDECRAVRSGVGLLEISTFGRYEVDGPGAGAWLDGLLATAFRAKVI
jgi:dimethylglycine dehydrogenase